MSRLPTDDEHTGKQWEEIFPREAGPPQVKPNTGADIFKETDPHYEIRLDAGAFRGLWEFLERHLKEYYPTHNTFGHVSASIRGLREFREVYWAANGGPPAPATEKGSTRHPNGAEGRRQRTGGRTPSPASKMDETKPARRPGEARQGRPKARQGPRRASPGERTQVGTQNPVETAAGALFEAITEHARFDAPVGKQFLLSKTQVPEHLFQPAIKALLKESKIARVGASRGAKYRPYRRTK